MSARVHWSAQELCMGKPSTCTWLCATTLALRVLRTTCPNRTHECVFAKLVDVQSAFVYGYVSLDAQTDGARSPNRHTAKILSKFSVRSMGCTSAYGVREAGVWLQLLLSCNRQVQATLLLRSYPMIGKANVYEVTLKSERWNTFGPQGYTKPTLRQIWAPRARAWSFGGLE